MNNKKKVVSVLFLQDVMDSALNPGALLFFWRPSEGGDTVHIITPVKVISL